jgi:hypothetical protein
MTRKFVEGEIVKIIPNDRHLIDKYARINFHKKELTRANEKEAEWFRDMEENYLSIQLAERI